MELTAKLDRAGRLMIPRQVRQDLGLTPESEVILSVEAGGLRIETRETALRRMQDYLQQFQRAGKSAVDELLKERRQEARREAARR